jgi:CubicO group peptidase (beta-lactamase class C family)
MRIKFALILLLYLPMQSIALESLQTDLDILLKDIEKIRKLENIPAIGLSLVKDGKVIFSGSFGVTDIESKQNVDSHSMFRMGSISKSFVGLAALKAQELGLFNLNDKINKYIDKEFIYNQWQKTHPILISHLLEHTAGLYDITADEFDHDTKKPISLKEAFLISPKQRVINWPPGTHHSYSNLGAPIVALLIEQTSGITFEDFVDTYILKPLGMYRSTFFHDNYVKQHLVLGHNSHSQYIVPYWNLAFRPFGALNSSPNEMSSFLLLLINNGKFNEKPLFSVKQIERMRFPKTTLAAKNGLRFGYGIGSYAVLRNGHVLYGHGGTTGGYLSEYRYSNEYNLGYMLAINNGNNSAKNSLRTRIEEYLFTNIPKNNPSEINSDVLDGGYSGYYKHATSRIRGALPLLNLLDTKKLVIEKKQLNMKSLMSQTVFLRPLFRGVFRQDNDPVATVALIKLENGKEYLQTPNANLEKISYTSYWGRQIIALSSICIILLGFVYALVWLPKKLLGKLPGPQNTWIRLIPFVSLPILLIPVILTILNLETFQFVNLALITKTTFILLTTIGIILSIKGIHWPVSKTAKVHIILTSLANVFFAVYFLI